MRTTHPLGRALVSLAPAVLLALSPGAAQPPQIARADDACASSLQSLVDGAAPGATVDIPACIFRETVTVSKPLVLSGQPGAEVRGSDVWADWVAEDGVWVSHRSVPGLPQVSQDPLACEPNTNNRCLWAEQVFIGGQALQPVPAGSRPGQGQFALIGRGDRRVRLGSDPGGHLVEVSTRPRWIVTGADGVVIRGLTMRHAGNGHASGAVSNDGHSDWVLEDSTLSDAHATDVSLDSGANVRLLRNEISRGGLGGVQGQRVSGGLVQGNTIHDNATAGFSRSWGSGGLKVTVVQDMAIDGNEVYDNDGTGLWCDISCAGVTYSNNRIHHNAWQGINFEISNGASIHDNAVWENGWGKPEWGWGAGIVVSSSANADIYNNVVAWNYAGISVIAQGRGDAPPQGPSGNFVHDNTIAKLTVDGDFSATYWQNLSLGWLSDSPGALDDPDRNNRASNNRFWYDAPEGDDVRFAWGEQFETVDEFDDKAGGAGSSYITTPELQAVLVAKDVPLRPEAHAVPASL